MSSGISIVDRLDRSDYPISYAQQLLYVVSWRFVFTTIVSSKHNWIALVGMPLTLKPSSVCGMHA